MIVEVLLYLLHLFGGCSFSIFLHSGVESGVNLQTVIVEVDILETFVFLAQMLDIFSNSLTEILRLTIVVVFHIEFRAVDGQLLELIEFLSGEVAMNAHVVKHHIAALQGILRVGDRIIVRCCLEHAYEDGTLVGGEFLWCGIEIRLGSRLDAKGIMAEINSVGILHQYFVLALLTSLCQSKIDFQFDGGNPFLGLHDENFHTRYFAYQTSAVLSTYAEHILGQLLCDGGGATSSSACCSILGSTEKSQWVDAPMVVKTFVFSVNKSTPKDGVNILILNGCTIFVKVFAEQYSVSRI